MRPLALLLAVALAGPTAAQTWTPRDDVNAALPTSIRVFEDAALGLVTVRADLTDTDWVLDAVLDRAGRTVPRFASGDDVLVAINGGYFGGGQSFSLVASGGTVLSPNVKVLGGRDGGPFYATRGAVGLSPARQPDVAWVYDVDGVQYAYPDPSPNAPGAPQPQPTATFPEGGAPWAIETAMGGGPVLVHDGAKRITYDEEVMFGSGVDLTSTRARTVVGYTPEGTLLILSAKESPGLTLSGAADVMLSLGAQEAVNLDGGGSTQLTAGGVDLVTSSRPVVSALLLRSPSLDEYRYFDTGSACCYRETGDWFESANAPFYGTTRSRLNETGDGSDRAVFTFDDVVGTAHTIEAWWVPAPNRATNTPFVVYSGGRADTVRVDQTDSQTAGRWNTLRGEFAFALSSGDSLVVSDDAAGTASPAFVSVDAVRVRGSVPPSTEGGPGALLDVRLSPNPTRGAVTATFVLRQPGTVRVEAMDLLGRVLRRDDRWLEAGEARVPVPMQSLRSGAYLVRVTTPEGTATRTVTRLR